METGGIMSVILFLTYSLMLLILSRADSVNDELKVPYVPHIVVNDSIKNFDFDSLQDTIEKYLSSKSEIENQQQMVILESIKKGTSLYDYLNMASVNQQNEKTHDGIANNQDSNHESNNKFNNNNSNNSDIIIHSINNNTNNNNNNSNYNSNNNTIKVQNYHINKDSNNNETMKYSYNSRNNASLNHISDINNNYYANNKNPNIRNNPYVVSSNIRNIQSGFTPMNVATGSYYIGNGYKNQIGVLDSIRNRTSNLYDMQKINQNLIPSRWRHSGDLTCNIKSVRFIRNQDCVSKKPVYESVCAEQCIGYDRESHSSMPNQYRRKNYNSLPYSHPMPRQKPILPRQQYPYVHQYGTNPTKYQALKSYPHQMYPDGYFSCTDGEVKHVNVNLHCSDGTILGHVIRIVKSCLCVKQTDKYQNDVSRNGLHPSTPRTTTTQSTFFSTFPFLKF